MATSPLPSLTSLMARFTPAPAAPVAQIAPVGGSFGQDALVVAQGGHRLRRLLEQQARDVGQQLAACPTGLRHDQLRLQVANLQLKLARLERPQPPEAHAALARINQLTREAQGARTPTRLVQLELAIDARRRQLQAADQPIAARDRHALAELAELAEEAQHTAYPLPLAKLQLLYAGVARRLDYPPQQGLAPATRATLASMAALTQQSQITHNDAALGKIQAQLAALQAQLPPR